MTAVVVVAVLGAGYGLFQPRLRRSRTWKATVTPLASIIGSGFLVVAPLLAATVGSWAPVGMAAIVANGYAVGWVMRHNIDRVEPLLEQDPPTVIHDLDRLSEIALGFAYTVSVAFYLRLLASFLLQPFGGDSEPAGRLIASTLMLAIGAVGWCRGFDGMETLEETAVDTKLSIIAGLLVGLVAFDVVRAGDLPAAFTAYPVSGTGWDIARALAGMVIVVQGFETSRYLGADFDAATRIRTMRLAQWVSGGIYLLFVTAVVPLFDTFPTQISDTAIMDAAVAVTPLLGPLVLVAAIASQLSAAVADTAGGGGMLVEGRRGSREVRAGYVAVLGGAATIVWVSNVFEIVAFASRAFALYYLLQAVLAAVVARRSGEARRLPGFVAVAAVMAFVVVFGIPAG